jgi:hypothetical protein
MMGADAYIEARLPSIHEIPRVMSEPFDYDALEETSPVALTPIDYSDLKSAQQENYNYHHVAARLAEFGYTTIRLYDDWNGADFIAKHVSANDDDSVLMVQLKSRLTFDKKYVGKGLYVAFPDGDDWYLYPHDTVLKRVVKELGIVKNAKVAWGEKGSYHIGSLSDKQKALLAPYKIEADAGEAAHPVG